MVIGRASELREASAVLADEGPSLRALVLRGDAGIGKTTIWRESVRLARERSGRVLVAEPAEAEAALAFSVVRDLLEQTGEGASAQTDVLAAGRAILAALQPGTILAIDDVQWIDPPSVAALTYALRRATVPLRVIVATRADGVPLGLDHAFSVTTMQIEPMSLAELDLLLRERLAVHAARPQLVRLHAASGGNPFYALEIARSADLSSDEPIALPAHLQAVPADRLGALSQPARDAVLLVAASMHPRTAVIERAVERHDGLEEALAAGVLQIAGDRLRFAHPLHATAAYTGATPWDRRAAHARLADVAGTMTERAVHLARATVDPDEQVAATLAAGAAAASADGMPGIAAELADRATALTPDEVVARNERAFAAALNWMAAGDAVAAESRLSALIDALDAGALRADVRIRLADLIQSARPEEARALCEAALDDAVEHPGLAANAHLVMSNTFWTAGLVHGCITHIKEAIACAERANDHATLAMSIGELLDCETILGMPLNDELAQRALAIERDLGDMSPSFANPSHKLATLYIRVDRLDEARPLIDIAMRAHDQAGDELTRWGVHVLHADLELRAGNLGAALRHATLALEGVHMLGYPELEPFVLRPLAMVLVLTGDLERARAYATNGLSMVEQTGNTWIRTSLLGVVGTVDLLSGDLESAWTSLSVAVDDLRAMEVGELSNSFIAASAIETAIGLGRLEEASGLCDWVADAGRPAKRAWHAMVAARGRALIATERGDIDTARAHIQAALAEQVPQPLERARTLLAQGKIERRAKNRKVARAVLTEALELFDALGAARLAESAAGELSRISGRAPADQRLSETERRVAELVTEGHSNKEIAAKLFVAVRTVEANLTRIYAKLGVRSRTELATTPLTRAD